MSTRTWFEEAYIQSKKHLDKLNLLREVDRRVYFAGFNGGREKEMFQEELDDLETTYKATLINMHKQVEDVLPSLLYYMEKFVTLHKQNEVVREKLDTLLEKTGRKPQEESDGGCDE